MFMRYRVEGMSDICPACGSTDTRYLEPSIERRMPYERKKVAIISGCENCGLIFINPQRDQAMFDAYYAPEGGWVNEKSKLLERHCNNPSRSIAEEYFTRETDFLTHPEVKAHIDILHPIQGRNSVLDFGCGPGNTLDLLKALGWTTYGSDPATRNNITEHTMLDELPRNEQFDLVIAHHVVEHLAHPLTDLGHIHRALKVGGFFLVGVPFLDNIGSVGKRAYCINYHLHSIAFSSSSLAALLNLAGFRVVTWFTRQLPARMGCLAVKSGETETTPTRPLGKGEEALKAHRRKFGSVESPWAEFLPVSVRAQILNRKLLRAEHQAQTAERRSADANAELARLLHGPPGPEQLARLQEKAAKVPAQQARAKAKQEHRRRKQAERRSRKWGRWTATIARKLRLAKRDTATT